MRASDVMTHDAVCCSRTTSVRNAARMLREFDIGVLPVIDELWTRKLIGIVTDRDLCLTALGEEHDPTLTTVEDCMATDPLTCGPETDIRDVFAAMAERQIRRMPVVDRDNTVLGMIGISDLVRHNAISSGEIRRLLERVTAPRQRVVTRAA